MTQQIKNQKQNDLLRGIRDLFPVVSIGLLAAIIMTGYWDGSTNADTRAANSVVPLIESNDPAIAKTLNNLRQLAAKNGSVRIIVGVRAPFAPEGRLSASSIALQRKQIAAMQSAVLNKVVSLKKNLATTKLFAVIPFMAIEANPSELKALTNLTEVTSIEEDRVATTSDAQSDSVMGMGATTAWSRRLQRCRANYRHSGFGRRQDPPFPDWQGGFRSLLFVQ